jgi:hypothetical protein
MCPDRHVAYLPITTAEERTRYARDLLSGITDYLLANWMGPECAEEKVKQFLDNLGSYLLTFGEARHGILSYYKQTAELERELPLSSDCLEYLSAEGGVL